MRIIVIFISQLLLVCSVALADSSDLKRFKPILDQAEAEHEAGNYKLAIKLFKKVYSRSEDLKRQSLKGLITSLKDSKKWDDGIETLKLEIKENPFIGEYRLWLADIYMGAEKFDEALVEINYAEKILGQDNAVLRIKSFVQQKLEKHPEAIDTLTVYLSSNSKDYNSLADRAESYFQQKLYAEAYKDFQKAYEIRPFDERVISSYVRTAYFNHNHQEVKRIGRECTKLFPKNISCYEYLGRSAFYKKDFTESVKYFNSAVSLNPNNIEIRQLLAESLAFNGKITDSDTQFEIILKEHPEFESAMRSWSVFLVERKKVEVLGSTLKTFNKNNPSNIWGAVELSKLLVFVGSDEGALEEMQTITEKNKSDIAKFYYAYFLDLSGDHKKARGILSELKDNKLNKDFHTGLSFFKEKKLDDAIHFWLQVPTDSAFYFKARVNAALALEEKNNIEKAKDILIALTPPTEFQKNLEKKIALLHKNTERKPASNAHDELTYFISWNTPQL